MGVVVVVVAVVVAVVVGFHCSDVIIVPTCIQILRRIWGAVVGGGVVVVAIMAWW